MFYRLMLWSLSDRLHLPLIVTFNEIDLVPGIEHALGQSRGNGNNSAKQPNDQANSFRRHRIHPTLVL